MKGRTLIIGFLVFVVLFGIGLFYALNFYHYSKTEHAKYDVSGLIVTNYTEIDATSSPIKYRACFELPADTVLYGDAGEPTPLVAPYWFNCFEAGQMTKDIKDGAASVVKYDENEPFGVTSYLMVYPDGRGYSWRQLNECGEAKFSGDPLPPQCPESETE